MCWSSDVYKRQVLGDISGFIESLGASLPENEYTKIGKNIWIHKTAQMAPTTAMGLSLIHILSWKCVFIS